MPKQTLAPKICTARLIGLLSSSLNACLTMKVFWVLLPSLFLVITAKAKNRCPIEEKQTLLGCYLDNFHSLRVDRYMLSVYELTMMRLFARLDTIEYACGNFTKLQKCLGHKVIKHCITPEGYSNLTINDLGQREAEAPPVFYYFSFLCGKGKQALINVHDCIFKLPSSCEVPKDESCEAFWNYTLCSADEAQQKCGPDAYYLVYEKNLIGECWLHPSCSICPKWFKRYYMTY